MYILLKTSRMSWAQIVSGSKKEEQKKGTGDVSLSTPPCYVNVMTNKILQLRTSNSHHAEYIWNVFVHTSLINAAENLLKQSYTGDGDIKGLLNIILLEDPQFDLQGFYKIAQYYMGDKTCEFALFHRDTNKLTVYFSGEPGLTKCFRRCVRFAESTK